MPQALPIIAGVVLIAEKATALVSFFVMAAVSAASAYLQQQMMDQPRDPGVLFNTRSISEEIPVIYGQDLVGGNDVVVDTLGGSNNDLWMIQTISEGEIDSIVQSVSVDQVFLNEEIHTDYPSNCYDYWLFTGTASHDYTSDAGLNDLYTATSARGEPYTDNYRHTAIVVWRLRYGYHEFSSPPRRTLLIKGRKLYDFRDSSTAWSDNPVLALYDYMTNDRYGLGYDSTELDAGATGSWADAATYCETKGWKINGTYSQKNSWDVIDSIKRLFRGQLTWWDGKFYLRYADLNDESSLMTLTDDHIVQDQDGRASLSIAQPSMFSRPDGLRLAFINPDKNYTLDHVSVGDVSGEVASVELYGCNDREHAANIAVYSLERRELDRGISGLFRDDAIKLEAHDLITFTSTAFGITTQLMRVTQADITPSGLIALTLAYESLDLYDDDYDVDIEDTYSCTLNNPTSIDAPTGIALFQAVSYSGDIPIMVATLTWTAPSDPLIDHYIVQYGPVEIPGLYYDFTTEKTFYQFFGMGGGYHFRVTSVNVSGVKSTTFVENDNQLSSQIIYASNAVTAASGLVVTYSVEYHALVPTVRAVLSWNASLDPYVAGYELQYKADAVTSWGDSGTFSLPLLGTDEDTFELDGFEDGTYDFRIRAIDNAGNTSSWSEENDVVVNTASGANKVDADLPWLIVGPESDRGEHANIGDALSALASAGTSSGGYSGIFIKDGTYTQTSQHTLSTSIDIHILGQSMGGVIIKPASNARLFYINNSGKNYRFSNFTIQTQVNTTATNIIEVNATTSQSSDLYVDSIYFDCSSSTYDIALECNKGIGGRLSVTDCIVEGASGGFAFDDYDWVSIKNNKISAQTCIAAYSTNNLVEISNNNMTALGTYGIQCSGGSDNINSGSISNNLIYCNTSRLGIYVRGSKLDITGNVITVSNYVGSSSPVGISVYDCDQSVISNNVVDVTYSGTASSRGIYLQGNDDSVVSGNQIRVNGSGTSLDNWGIYLYGASDRNIVNNNQIDLVRNGASPVADDIGIGLASTCYNNDGGDNITYNVSISVDDNETGGSNSVSAKDV